MKAERYLRLDKREFLLQVVVIRLVKLLRIICLVFSILGVVEDLTEHSPSRAFAVLRRDLQAQNFVPMVGLSTAALNGKLKLGS